MRKRLSLLLAIVMVITALTGCGTQTADATKNETEHKVKNEGGKEKVTVALWGTQLLENYTQYLCDHSRRWSLSLFLQPILQIFTGIGMTIMICRIS